MNATRLRILTHMPVGLVERATRDVPGVELIPVPAEGALDPEIRGEALLTQAWGSENLAEIVGRGVRWVHSFGTGVNAFPYDALGACVLTCSRGASAIPISEWVLAAMLAAEKKLPDAWIHEPPKRWNRFDLGGLHGKTLGIVGFGGIGREVAKRALPFGMRVLAHRRTQRPSPVPDVEMVGLGELLAAADHLVLAVPATPMTQHLMDRDAFAQIGPGAHLINIARGALVDQDALRDALDSGRVALASLDVVEPEPLPAGHWLYSHPKVRLSPHCSWNMPGALEWLLAPFVENIHRFMADEPLLHQVDIEHRY